MLSRVAAGFNKSSLDLTAGSTDNGYVAYYAKNVYTAEGGSRITDTADGFRFFYDGAEAYLLGYYGSETDITLPESFTAYDGTEVTSYSVYNYAFYYNTSLTSVTIPDSVISIGNEAFYNCSGLTSLVIPDSVTSIGNYAFLGCSGLTSVSIGSGVTSIGNWAFSGCSGLTSVTIPAGVTSIGWNAFEYCNNIQTATIPAIAISEISKNSLKTVVINGGTEIANNAFYNCSGLTSVTIPDSVTSIGNYAFEDCSGLTSVSIGSSVTSIGSSAFSGCVKLIEVYNKSSNGYVAYYAKNVYTAEGGSRITDTADGFRFFYDGTEAYLLGYYGSETDITLPESFTAYDGTEVTSYSVYNYAFYNNINLTSVTIPGSVASIGSKAIKVHLI